jgi:hypothetical protein
MRRCFVPFTRLQLNSVFFGGFAAENRGADFVKRRD